MTGFERRAATALRDPVRVANVHRFTERAHDNRTASVQTIDFEALRNEGERIRSEAVADLPALLDRFQANLERNGVVVHRAATGADAAAYITEVVLRHGTEVVKGKSMASEEIGLNERLGAAGVDVAETDLGEFIVQTAGEAPEHIIIPAIHKSRADVRALLEPLAGEPIGDDPADLTAFARAHLRERFLRAPVGITGVNFGVAETGTLVLVENEGNGRMCSGLPRVHIAIMGMERIVANMADLATLLPLLIRSGTGQKITSYVSLVGGPRRGEEADGPDEVHLVILDNGRSRVRDTRLSQRPSLHPLRRLPERLPGLPPGRRHGLRVGVRRADRRGADAAPAPPGRPRRARPGIVAVRRLRRRLPGADPAARAPARPAPRSGGDVGRTAGAAGVPGLEHGLEPPLGLPPDHPHRPSHAYPGPGPVHARAAAQAVGAHARRRGEAVIEQFQAELEAVGGHVHHGRAALDALRGEGVAVTPCLALIAATGTVVVSSRLSGGRRNGLVDPVHVVEARADQLVPDLAAALERVGPELASASAVTFVTGPSRTADIEQTLIRGVHGPKDVHVVFVES